MAIRSRCNSYGICRSQGPTSCTRSGVCYLDVNRRCNCKQNGGNCQTEPYRHSSRKSVAQAPKRAVSGRQMQKQIDALCRRLKQTTKEKSSTSMKSDRQNSRSRSRSTPNTAQCFPKIGSKARRENLNTSSVHAAEEHRNAPLRIADTKPPVTT